MCHSQPNLTVIQNLIVICVNILSLSDVYFQVRLIGVTPCVELTVYLLLCVIDLFSTNHTLQVVVTEEKLDDILNAVLEHLKVPCPECSAVIIDEQSFSCYEESPTHVTYRARLSGTSERASDSLISLIEDWVRVGPTIIVTGVLLTVDSHCSVAISSPSDPECSTAATSNSGATPSIPIIVGGVVVGVIAVIAMAVAIPVTTKLVVKRRSKAFKLCKV